jgi:hypothetical protein
MTARAREFDALRPELVRVAEARGERSVIAFTLDAGRIVAIDVVRNPDKLRGVAA